MEETRVDSAYAAHCEPAADTSQPAAGTRTLGEAISRRKAGRSSPRDVGTTYDQLPDHTSRYVCWSVLAGFR